MSLRNSFQSTSGALFLLTNLLWSLVFCEISNNFSLCRGFFYKKTPPKGIRLDGYQAICQRYRNQYRFASLHHRKARTPLFSAYILSPADGKRPKINWMYEPQLASSRANPEMQAFSKIVNRNVFKSQAVIEDYTNSNYTKGHLNPSMHQKTENDRRGTFTLTNIVPQKAGSNAGPWNLWEIELLRKFKFCNSSMYVITGAMRYKGKQPMIKCRVSVPEYLWSAYCCPSLKSDLPKSERKFFPTFAAVGRNDPDSGEEIVPINTKAKAEWRGYDVRQMPLETLEKILAERLKMPVSLFEGNCRK